MAFSLRKIFNLTKRRKFVLSALLLSLNLILVQQFQGFYHYLAIGGATLLTMGLTAWSLKEDLHKIGWLMALILPTLFTASINLFYFLLPEKIYIQIILLILFAIGMYAILLTENIFIVAAWRTIQLLRAAQALGFVLTLFVAFLLFDTIFSFRLEPWFNAGLVFVVSLPLILQGIWSATLDESLTKPVLTYSLILTVILTQITFFISLWPVTIVITSLFLVTILYVGLGIIQQALVGRLFKQTAFEYLRVGILVLIIVFLTTSWRG